MVVSWSEVRDHDYSAISAKSHQNSNMLYGERSGPTERSVEVQRQTVTRHAMQYPVEMQFLGFVRRRKTLQGIQLSIHVPNDEVYQHDPRKVVSWSRVRDHDYSAISAKSHQSSNMFFGERSGSTERSVGKEQRQAVTRHAVHYPAEM
ncbi:hypothetical protein TNCV_4044381 [Trichonephila clavipes]|nr:hypothetical protein TNCV_4044381 [Trichonephila clavipes]